MKPAQLVEPSRPTNRAAAIADQRIVFDVQRIDQDAIVITECGKTIVIPVRRYGDRR